MFAVCLCEYIRHPENRLPHWKGLDCEENFLKRTVMKYRCRSPSPCRMERGLGGEVYEKTLHTEGPFIAMKQTFRDRTGAW